MKAIKKKLELKMHNNTKAILFLIFLIQMTERSISRDMRWSKEVILIMPIFLCFFAFLYLVVIKKKTISKMSFLYAILIAASAFLSMLINQDFGNDNFFIISTLICGFFISNLFSRDEYLNAYSKAILFYCVFSIIATYVLHPLVMQGSLNIFPVYTNHTGTPFTDYGFAYVVRWYGFRRNQGYFTEPGVFQFYIFIAIFIEVFYFERKNYLSLIILFLTLVSTFSTIALIGLIPLIIIYFIKSYKIHIKKHLVIFALLSLAIYMFFNNNTFYETVRYSVFEKLHGFDGKSFVVRFESIQNLLKNITKSPLFGSSFVNGFIYIQENYITYNTMDVTGTFFIYLMGLGIPIGSVILWNFIKFCDIITRNKSFYTIVIFSILFFSANTQNLVYDLILMTLIFVPYMKRGNEYAPKTN